MLNVLLFIVSLAGGGWYWKLGRLVEGEVKEKGLILVWQSSGTDKIFKILL